MRLGRMIRCIVSRIALILVFTENSEDRAVQMQFTALCLACHRAQIASRIPDAVLLSQGRMIGDQHAKRGAGRPHHGAGFVPGGFVDPEFRQQAMGRIDEVFPVERPVVNRDVGAEPVRGGIEHLFPGHVIKAGC